MFSGLFWPSLYLLWEEGEGRREPWVNLRFWFLHNQPNETASTNGFNEILELWGLSHLRTSGTVRQKEERSFEDHVCGFSQQEGGVAVSKDLISKYCLSENVKLSLQLGTAIF